MNDGIKKMMSEIKHMKDVRRVSDNIEYSNTKTSIELKNIDNYLKDLDFPLSKGKVRLVKANGKPFFKVDGLIDEHYRDSVGDNEIDKGARYRKTIDPISWHDHESVIDYGIDNNNCYGKTLNPIADLKLADTGDRVKIVNSILSKINSQTDVITPKDVYSLVGDALEERFLDRKPIKDNPASLYDRDLIISTVSKKLLTNEYTQGDALKKLRVNVLNLDQERFAKLVGVSRKTISDIENNKGNYTVSVLNGVFKPFGLRVSITPTSPEKLKQLL